MRRPPKALVAFVLVVVATWAVFYVLAAEQANDWREDLDKSLAVGKVSDVHYSTIEWHFGRTFDDAWSEPYVVGAQTVEKPVEWQPAFARLSVAIEKQDWLTASDEIKALEEMLPDPIIEDYPWSPELRDNLLAGHAQLLLFAMEFDRAEAACEDVLRATASSPNRSVARDYAYRTLARVHAYRGDFVAASNSFEESRNAYWSGCGNCEEGEEQWASPIQQVYQACQLSRPQAVERLSQLREGRISVYNGSIIGSDSGYQRSLAWTEATFALAVLSLQKGDEVAARRMLTEAALSHHTSNDARCTALGWLATLKWN